MLRHLYAWHLDLLLLAASRRHSANLAGPGVDGDTLGSLLERQNFLFMRLAEAGGNPEHILALRALTERMEPYRRLEEELLDAAQSETDAISAAIAAADRRALRKSLIAYHRRRARLIPQLIAMAHSN